MNKMNKQMRAHLIEGMRPALDVVTVLTRDASKERIDDNVKWAVDLIRYHMKDDCLTCPDEEFKRRMKELYREMYERL